MYFFGGFVDVCSCVLCVCCGCSDAVEDWELNSVIWIISKYESEREVQQIKKYKYQPVNIKDALDGYLAKEIETPRFIVKNNATHPR